MGAFLGHVVGIAYEKIFFWAYLSLYGLPMSAVIRANALDEPRCG